MILPTGRMILPTVNDTAHGVGKKNAHRRAQRAGRHLEAPVSRCEQEFRARQKFRILLRNPRLTLYRLNFTQDVHFISVFTSLT